MCVWGGGEIYYNYGTVSPLGMFCLVIYSGGRFAIWYNFRCGGGGGGLGGKNVYIYNVYIYLIYECIYIYIYIYNIYIYIYIYYAANI